MPHFELGPKTEKVALGTLKSGERVVDRQDSHVHRSAELDAYLPRALEQIVPEGRDFIVEAVDFGEVIGETSCVETEEGDDIVYAKRVGRTGLTRFVKSKTKSPTSELTVVLKKVDDGYMALTAFLGPKAEKEPWDVGASEEAKVFWKTHALVWGSEAVVLGTETTLTPDTFSVV